MIVFRPRWGLSYPGSLHSICSGKLSLACCGHCLVDIGNTRDKAEGHVDMLAVMGVCYFRLPWTGQLQSCGRKWTTVCSAPETSEEGKSVVILCPLRDLQLPQCRIREAESSAGRKKFLFHFLFPNLPATPIILLFPLYKEFEVDCFLFFLKLIVAFGSHCWIWLLS